MEKPPINKKERKSGLVRIVGEEENYEQELLDKIGNFFDRNQEMIAHEIEKTPEQKEIIDFINRKMPEFVRRYGGEPIFISGDKVHILPEEIFPDKESQAFYSPQTHAVCIKSLEGLRFANSLTHELLHFNSFQSISLERKAGEVSGFKHRRMGLRMGKKDKKDFAYLGYLDEAIIIELVKRFRNEFFSEVPHLKSEMDYIISTMPEEVPRSVAEDVTYISETKKGNLHKVSLHTYAYSKYRKVLKELISEIYSKNKGDFNSEEEIFKLFGNAVMSGRILPLARLIKKTFNEKTLRDLGERYGLNLTQISG